MKRIHFFALMLTAASLLALTACSSGKPSEEGHARAIRLIQNAYEERDYQELLRLADSLCTIGELSEPEAYYWQGYACDRTKQLRMAEFYWKTAVAQTSNSTAPEDLAIYAKSASHLANVLGSRGEYDVVLDLAQPVVKRLEELKCDTMSDYNNLVLIIGLCQSRFGLSRDAANESYEQAYQTHMKNIEENRSDEAYKSAIAGVVNIAYNCNETESYRDALIWIDRYAELIRQYEQRTGADPNYVDRQWARYDIYRAIALDGMGKKDEAAKVYEHYLTTQYSQTPEGRIAVNDYLTVANRWTEVADNYESLDDLLGHKDYSIEDFQKMVLPKFKANLKADRRETAMAVALDISHSLDSAITQARKQDAQELSVIRQKAEKLAADEADATRKRTNNLLIAIGVLFAVLAIYSFYSRKRTHGLVKKYKDLKVSLNDKEAALTNEARSIMEQDIARNFQSALALTSLPQHNDISLFATLRPAKDTNGEFYDSVVRNNKLFFCIGDAKGKGVATPLGLAITKERFRSTISEDTEPAQIVSIINKALVDRQITDLSVTLFVGILDLATGRLRYTNAGHTAPMLVGSGIGLLPIDQHAALGISADNSYNTQETRIDPGTLIFLYTQDMLEVKNATNDTYGQRRMMGESLQAMKVLQEKLSPESFTNWMKEAIDRFMGEGATNEALTMFTLQYKQRKPGAPYQRSISITNDPKNEPYITFFTTEACAALGMKERFSEPIAKEMVDLVKDITKQAYPDGTKGDIHIEAHAEDTTLKFVVSAADKELTLTKEISKQ
jgi:serine phosphatase RsbU (regulator of sigma subunit)